LSQSTAAPAKASRGESHDQDTDSHLGATRSVLRTALIAGASLLAMTGAAHAQSASGATQTPEQQQARIEALEAQLEALSARSPT
jgi:hypothetical protein